MKLAYDLVTDRFTRREPRRDEKSLASWYAPGLSDELGDRLLMFDNSSAPSFELLRFRGVLTTRPGFEVALRRRVERLSHFRHPSFATVRAVEYLGPGDGLALISNYTPGRRLSEAFHDARGPAFATALLQQLTPALATLHQFDEGTGHGALAPSRIVISPEGRLTIVEHVLGPALERLLLPASRLRSDLGIPVPPRAQQLRLDPRTDHFQLGLIALSILLGRRVGPEEAQANVARLLEQVARTGDRESSPLLRRLRVWLERALQIDDQVFESSTDALEALDGLSDAGRARTALREQPLRAVIAEAAPIPESVPEPPKPAGVGPESATRSAVPDELALVTLLTASREALDDVEVLFLPETFGRHAEEPLQMPGADAALARAQRDRDDGQLLPSRTMEIAQQAQQDGSAASIFIERPDRLANTPAPSSTKGAPPPRPSPAQPKAAPPRAQRRGRLGGVRSLVAGLAVCVVSEGFVIATLVRRPAAGGLPTIVVESLDPGANVLVDGRSAGVTPLHLTFGSGTRSIRVVGASPRPSGGDRPAPEIQRSGDQPAPAAKAAVRAADSAAPVAQRTGGIRLMSPIEIDVFEGDRRLGSSATGIVSMTAGRHELELVNSVVGYRTRQAINVRGGQVVPVAISPPNGRLSINAVPWAEVWIDGRSVGETPLGNLSVPLGEHLILFRHPQLGEHRQTVVVRMNAITRVSANLQR